MPKENKIKVCHFLNGINIGGDIKMSIEKDKHKADMEKTASGIWLRRPGFSDRWVPDSNIKWYECE